VPTPAATPPASTQAPAAQRLHDPALDGLRGLAVLLVYVFHYGGGLQSHNPAVRLLGYLTQAGWTGVVLFFALSGFLITGSLWDSLRNAHWLRNFYARRALRILPLYFLVLALCTLLAIARGTRFSDLGPLALYAFFLQNLPFLTSRALEQPSPLPLYHLWSLAVEEQFYLLWPALLWMAAGRRRALRLTLWSFAVVVAFRLIVYTLPRSPETSHQFDQFLLTQAGALVLGAALALALRGPRWPRIQSLARPAFFAGLAVFLLTGLYTHTFLLHPSLQFSVGLPAVEIASAALIPILLHPGLPRALASIAPLRWLGRISYGFYIFHILLEPLFDNLGTHLTHTSSGQLYQAARFFAAFPITAALATLSYYLVELPFLHRKRSFPLHQPLPQPPAK
jgi:peptidoglycan/LPS O-acetylase OafA/YrhL